MWTTWILMRIYRDNNDPTCQASRSMHVIGPQCSEKTANRLDRESMGVLSGKSYILPLKYFIYFKQFFRE